MFRCYLGSIVTHSTTRINNHLVSKTIIANKHTTPFSQDDKGPREWPNRNNYIYPPQKADEEPRPAFVVHMKENIKYSPKTMWYIASLVRGLTVDEAIKQLSFCVKKGAIAAKETILEAQKIAVDHHNVEFKSNLWISESFVGKGTTVKGIRRCAKARRGMITYRYVHYFVKLEEGKPPKHYYLPEPKSKQDLLNEWLNKLRKRKVGNTL